MKKELAKAYQPKEFEDRIYALWNEKECFKAVPDSKEKAIYNSYSSAQYNRSAAYGSRT